MHMREKIQYICNPTWLRRAVSETNKSRQLSGMVRTLWQPSLQARGARDEVSMSIWHCGGRRTTDRHSEADCAKTQSKEQMASLPPTEQWLPGNPPSANHWTAKKLKTLRCPVQPHVPPNTGRNSRTGQRKAVNLGAAVHWKSVSLTKAVSCVVLLILVSFKRCLDTTLDNFDLGNNPFG